MKKILVTLMMVFSLSVAAFAKVKLVPKDTFNNYIVSMYEDTPFIQPQIAYVADTWKDVYEKTGVDKYGWMSISSTYCDNATYQYFLIVKVRVEGGSRDQGWICYEFPGDDSEIMYVADVEY